MKDSAKPWGLQTTIQSIKENVTMFNNSTVLRFIPFPVGFLYIYVILHYNHLRAQNYIAQPLFTLMLILDERIVQFININLNVSNINCLYLSKPHLNI